MKKTVALFIGLVSAVSAFAGAGNVRIMFSTPGPDTYADKSAVKAGERYALVWRASADKTVSFSANGSVTGGKAVLVWDTKENGRCSQVLFQVDDTWLANQGMSGGVWSVYLLDTRVYSGDTYTYAPLNAEGLPTLINASSVAVADVAAQDSVVAGAVSGGTASELPSDFIQPTITGIQVKDQFVEVTVENTSSSVNYVLAEGDRPDAMAPSASAKPQVGKGTITLVTPKTSSGSKFFTVNRK